MLAHATDGVARAVEDLQFTLGEGPAIDARVGRTPVLISNLAEPSHVDHRWPTFRTEVTALGVQALFAFPIRIGNVSLGSLGLYRRSPGDLSTDEVRQGIASSQALGESLVAEADPDSDRVAGYPMSVHRAAGMVMVQLGSSIDTALMRLRATAYLEGRPISTVALDVLDGRQRFHKEEK